MIRNSIFIIITVIMLVITIIFITVYQKQYIVSIESDYKSFYVKL